MTGATHYIEQYKHDGLDKEYTTPIRPIDELQKNLSLTKHPLKTIAVWKIKYKLGYSINDIPDTVG